MRGADLRINLLMPCTLHAEVRAVKIVYASIMLRIFAVEACLALRALSIMHK